MVFEQTLLHCIVLQNTTMIVTKRIISWMSVWLMWYHIAENMIRLFCSFSCSLVRIHSGLNYADLQMLISGYFCFYDYYSTINNYTVRSARYIIYRLMLLSCNFMIYLKCGEFTLHLWRDTAFGGFISDDFGTFWQYCCECPSVIMTSDTNNKFLPKSK